MSASTTIEWTNKTWNPVRGCQLVSEGCSNCYAMKQAHRFSGRGQPYEGLTRPGGKGPVWTGDVRLIPEALAAPLRWRKPQMIFVNSMSDLFHEGVPFEFITAVFGVMMATKQHAYQVLTKRPDRMLGFFDFLRGTKSDPREVCEESAMNLLDESVCHLQADTSEWPLPNVWLGVSVENQKTADERIPLLLHTPAAVRWISAEPLLGPIDLRLMCLSRTRHWTTGIESCVDWLVTGGESGPKARPSHPDWYRSLRDQCQAARVPFFFKQWGEFAPESSYYRGVKAGEAMIKVGKKAAGSLLDGKEWKEMPKL